MAKERKIIISGHADQDRAPEWLKESNAAAIDKYAGSELDSEKVDTAEEVEEAVEEIEEVVEEESEIEEIEDEVADIESEVEDLPVAVVDKKAKKLEEQKGVVKKIGKLTAEKKAAEERVRELEARLAARPAPQLIQGIVAEDHLINPATKQRVDMPRASDYAHNTALYLEDMQAYNNLKQRVVHAVTSYDTKQQVEAYKKELIEKEYQPRLRDAQKRYADFAEKVNNPGQIALEAKHPWLLDVLKESEFGPDIVYKLADDQDQLAEMRDMSAPQLAKFIGKLEAKEEMKVKPRTTSSAPKPINSAGKLGGMVSGTVKTKSVESWTTADWKKSLKTRR